MSDHQDRRAGPEPGANGARPTLKTIAYMTGLGVTTVSRALKDAPEIGKETRQRVQMVAKQVGYRPNRAGVRLRTGKTNVVSLILNTGDEVLGLLSPMVYGITEVLADTAYHLVVTPYSQDRDPMVPVRYVVETGSADGVIISRIQQDDPRVRYLVDHGVPFATHGRTTAGIDHPFHDFDNDAFAAAAVRRLAERGRRRLALLAPPPTMTFHDHLTAGFERAMAACGATGSVLHSLHIDMTLDAVRDRVIDLMNGPNRPDGIVSASASSTFAVVAAIEACGLALGREIDVVSKQASPLLHWFRPGLHLVHEDVRHAGRELARLLLASIRGAPAAQLQTLSSPVLAWADGDGGG